MSKFLETAKLADPIVSMLVTNGCRGASTSIFEDGSGSFIVSREHADEVDALLRARGVNLYSYSSARDADNYIRFTFDLGALKKFSETLCPHCGKDITEA